MPLSPGWGCHDALVGTSASPHPELTQLVGPHHPHASRIRLDGHTAGPSASCCPSCQPPTPRCLGSRCSELPSPHMRGLCVSNKEEKQTLLPGSLGQGEREAYGLGFPGVGVSWLIIVGSDPKAQVCGLEGVGEVLLPWRKKTKLSAF